MNTNLNAPMSLAAMRATLCDDQRAINRKILDSMNVPRAQRDMMEKTLAATARRLIDAMPDADVRQCFE
jgi:hypothetical protein